MGKAISVFVASLWVAATLLGQGLTSVSGSTKDPSGAVIPGATVVLIGSPAEMDVSDQVGRQMRTKPIVLTGETTVADATAIISAADLLITNDTGPAHIGSAVGTPTLVIFGPTNPLTTYPFGSRAEIIRHPPDCAPCMLRDCPIDHRCMTAITVDEVFAQAKALMSRQRLEVSA